MDIDTSKDHKAAQSPRVRLACDVFGWCLGLLLSVATMAQVVHSPNPTRTAFCVMNACGLYR
jgi:hypothetical protein